MPVQVRKSSDNWEVVEADGPQYQALADWDGSSPLLLQCDEEPDGTVANAAAIAIEFPTFVDGRALSLAVLLRTRLGFTGELRAMGATHEDTVHYLVRCGFDAIDVAENRQPERYLALTNPYSGHYQGSVIQPEQSFQRVTRGANA
ncbi:MAG: DUF934 domain-containing protein [Pseudomonadales bacterium]|nr:DUF934 domain-containing protein [Pseudomonadales bacterium]